MAELRALQDRLWAERRRSLLVVLQGTDASGKDSTIRHVFTGLNPHGCRVEDFAQRARPSSRTTTCGASTHGALRAARSGSGTAPTTRT